MSGYDPAAAMLEEFMRSQEARTSAHLHCGNGRVALASLAGGATELWCSDRRLTSVIATRELIAARGVDAAHVVHAQGAIGFPDDARVEAVTIRIPTERMGMQQLVHDAFNLLVNNGVCVLAGGNNEGVKPAVRTLESVFGNSSIEMNHSGHRLVVARKTTLDVVERNTLETRWLDPDEFNTLHVAARGRDVTLFTRPGVFSWEHLDEATSILADEMDIRAVSLCLTSAAVLDCLAFFPQ